MLGSHALSRFLGWGKTQRDACRRAGAGGPSRGAARRIGASALLVSGGLTVASLCLVACGAAHTDISSVPKHQPGDNPFVGHQLLIDSQSAAAQTAERWSLTRPDDARAMKKIADQP